MSNITIQELVDFATWNNEGVMIWGQDLSLQAINSQAFRLLSLNTEDAPIGAKYCDVRSKLIAVRQDQPDAPFWQGCLPMDDFSAMCELLAHGADAMETSPNGQDTTLRIRHKVLDDRWLITHVTELHGAAEKQRKMLSQKQNLEITLEKLTDGVMMMDADGRILHCNQRFIELFDVDPEKFWVGITARDFAALHGDLADADSADREIEITARSSFATTAPENLKAGTVNRNLRSGRVVEVTRTPLPSGGSVLTARDITAETERQKLLEEAKLAAEDANRMKSEFIAKVTHELRTPMHGVLGMAALIERSELDDGQRRFLEVLQRSGRHMVDLIDGLLTISTLETGELMLEPDHTDLDLLVRDCIEMTRPRAVDKGLDLNVTTNLDVRYVNADGMRLTQILVNLLTNAVKFTDTGVVALYVETKVDGDRVSIQADVSDTGPGIAADQANMIFQKFAQLDGSIKRKHEGVGLGLSIASSLAELMDGRLSVASTVGVGSVFSLNAKLDKAQPLENRVAV